MTIIHSNFCYFFISYARHCLNYFSTCIIALQRDCRSPIFCSKLTIPHVLEYFRYETYTKKIISDCLFYCTKDTNKTFFVVVNICLGCSELQFWEYRYRRLGLAYKRLFKTRKIRLYPFISEFFL